jgi:hypothetical protein
LKTAFAGSVLITVVAGIGMLVWSLLGGASNDGAHGRGQETPSARRTTCPVDDPVLCRFALDLVEALNSRDSAWLEEHIGARALECGVNMERYPGCPATPTPGATADVVALFNYGSDCCYLTVGEFHAEFAEVLRSGTFPGTGQPGNWSVDSIILSSPFWDGNPAIVVAEGDTDDDKFSSQVIEFGTTADQGELQIVGLIKGVQATRYAFPQSTVLPWEASSAP